MLIVAEIKKYVENRIMQLSIKKKQSLFTSKKLIKFNNILKNIKRFENDTNRKN